MAYHPEVQHYVAEMRMNLETIEAYLDRTASDWTTGVEHPDWPLKIVSTKVLRKPSCYLSYLVTMSKPSSIPNRGGEYDSGQ